MNEHPTAAAGARTDDRLHLEASVLHRLLFGSEIPAELADRYAEAHGFVHLSGDSSQMSTVSKVIDLNLDAEAVELALRQRHLRHPLRQKMLILAYLAEADCRYYSLFINERASLVKALLVLASQLIRTSLKMVKGKLLVWRHSLA